MTTQPNSSVAFYKSRGCRIALVHQDNCDTCCHPRRRMIERFLIDGVVPRVIAERLKNQSDPSEQSIRRHYQRGHLPVDARTVVERQEERADKRWREHGQAVTEHLRTEYKIEQLVLAEYTKRVQSGRVKPTFGRAGAAAEFISRMELAAEDERAEQAERMGVVSLLAVIDGLIDATPAGTARP